MRLLLAFKSLGEHLCYVLVALNFTGIWGFGVWLRSFLLLLVLCDAIGFDFCCFVGEGDDLKVLRRACN